VGGNQGIWKSVPSGILGCSICAVDGTKSFTPMTDPVQVPAGGEGARAPEGRALGEEGEVEGPRVPNEVVAQVGRRPPSVATAQ